jgi:hypothetical protein
VKVAKVTFDNGDTITTNINGTDKDIKSYYMNNIFDMGIYPEEKMCKAVSVEVWPDDTLYDRFAVN